MGEQEDNERESDLEIGGLADASSVAEEAVFLPPDTFVDLPEGDIRQAAEHAALRAGLSLDAWIERSIRKCATEELGDIELPVPAPADAPAPDSAPETTSPEVTDATPGISEERLEALEKRFEDRLQAQTELLSELMTRKQEPDRAAPTQNKRADRKDKSEDDPEILVPHHEDGEIQALLHEYFGVLLPSAQRIETVMQQLDVLLDRSVDYRDLNGFLTKLAEEAERTSATLVPLEKAFNRLAENKLPAAANPPTFSETPPRPLPGGSGISRLFRGQD